MNVVLMAAREREESEKDKLLVEGIIRDLHAKYKRYLNVISISCNRGIGKYVKEFCMKNKIIFVECRMRLEGKNAQRTFFAHVFQARNATLLELGDEFYIFKGPKNWNGIVESIVEPAEKKVKKERVHVYEYEGS